MANLSHRYGRPFKGLRRASPSYRRRFDHGEPIAKIDTRPMVFVAVFLAIMAFLWTTPIRPHAFDIELWDGETTNPLLAGSTDNGRSHAGVPLNRVTISADDQILWNGDPIHLGDFVVLLDGVRAMDNQPLVEFIPAPNAKYDTAVKTLFILRMKDVRFQIAGLQEHCHFDSDWSSVASNQDSSLNLALTLAIPQRGDESSFSPYHSIPADGSCEERLAVHTPD